MNRNRSCLGLFAPLAGLATLVTLLGCATDAQRAPKPTLVTARPDPAAAKRGEYLFAAANCVSCHTNGKNGVALAGGRAIVTGFGTFFSRNITSDPVHGIGAWSDDDFVRALRDGIAPDGSYYFPAFPFPAFSGMTDRDILDIKAYLFIQAPASQANRPPNTPVPRMTMAFWRALYFSPGPLAPDPKQSAEWNRGAYLVTAVAHCGECHTPRGFLGGLDTDDRFAGADLADGGTIHAPNITWDRGAGIGKWSEDDLVTVLTTGMKPNGDFVARPMSEVVDGVAKLTDADRRAIANYIKSLPAIPAERN